nr:hypothetical protein [Candidatus Gracilibacteria bacterium]
MELIIDSTTTYDLGNIVKANFEKIQDGEKGRILDIIRDSEGGLGIRTGLGLNEIKLVGAYITFLYRGFLFFILIRNIDNITYVINLYKKHFLENELLFGYYDGKSFDFRENDIEKNNGTQYIDTETLDKIIVGEHIDRTTPSNCIIRI